MTTWLYFFEVDEDNETVCRRWRSNSSLEDSLKTYGEFKLILPGATPVIIKSSHKYLGENNCSWDATSRKVAFNGYNNNSEIIKNGAIDHLIDSGFNRTLELGLLRKALAELLSSTQNKAIVNSSDSHVQEFLDYHNNIETEKNRLKANLIGDESSAGNDLEIVPCTFTYYSSDNKQKKITYSSSEFSPKIDDT